MQLRSNNDEFNGKTMNFAFKTTHFCAGLDGLWRTEEEIKAGEVQKRGAAIIAQDTGTARGENYPMWFCERAATADKLRGGGGTHW